MEFHYSNSSGSGSIIFVDTTTWTVHTYSNRVINYFNQYYAPYTSDDGKYKLIYADTITITVNFAVSGKGYQSAVRDNTYNVMTRDITVTDIPANTDVSIKMPSVRSGDSSAAVFWFIPN